MKSLIFPMVCMLMCMGCNKAENLPDLPVEQPCDLSELNIPARTSCEDFTNLNPALYCRYEYMGEVNLLSSTPAHNPYLCPSLHTVSFVSNDSVKYPEGKKVYFSMEVVLGKYQSSWSGPCTPPDNRLAIYCSERENATATIKNEFLGLEFMIDLNPGERFLNSTEDFDNVNIAMALGDSSYAGLILYNVRRDGSPILTSTTALFHPQIILEKDTFENVFHFNPPPSEAERVETYYNAFLGIIAFRDREGTLWTFDGFR